VTVIEKEAAMSAIPPVTKDGFENEVRRLTGLVMQAANELSEDRAEVIARAFADDWVRRFNESITSLKERALENQRSRLRNPPE
jgi:hypothetical protein